MISEAESAGLKFDKIKMANLTCCPDKIDEYGDKDSDHYAKFHASLHESGTRRLHTWLSRVWRRVTNL